MQRIWKAGSRRRAGLLIGLGVFAVVAILNSLGRLQPSENALLGLRFEFRGVRQVTAPVILVCLEEGSVLPEGSAEPWSLAGMAELVRRLDEADAAVIGLDFAMLAGNLLPGSPPDEERLLADAMRVHGGVVLPVIVRERPTGKPGDTTTAQRFALGPGTLRRPEHLLPGHLTVPSDQLVAAAAGLGSTNIYPDPDGAAREAPLAISWRETIYPTFWTELVRVYEGLPPAAAHLEAGRVVQGEHTWRTDADAEVLINYVGGYRAFPSVSWATTMQMPTEALRKLVAGKIVVAGADIAGLSPLLRSPTAPLMPGVEIAATITENLVADTPLVRLPPWVDYTLTLALCLLVGWLGARSGPLETVLLMVVALALLLSTGFGLFLAQIYLPLMAPTLAVALTGGLLVANAAAYADRRRTEAETRLQSRLQAISGIGRLASSSLDQRRLLVEILRWAQSEIDAEGSSLLLMEPDGEHLRFEVALGDKGEMLRDITLRLGEGIAGTVAQTGEAIVSQDVARDPRWSRDVAYAIDFETRSILCVPMTLRERIIGVIEVLNKRSGRFTDNDVQLLQVIAQQAALFIENARLYAALSHRADVADAELRRTNERLAFEMARIATLVDEMGDGVVATDEADRVVIFNNAAEVLFGIDGRWALGRPAVTVFEHPRLVELFAMPLSPHGGSWETEISLDEAGRQVVLARIALISQPGQQAVGKCAVFSDISHLKALDRMKMDLISFVSHELKNPIASLMGACQMLHARLHLDDERTARLLEIATRQSRRMQYLVQDFLDLARIEAGQCLELRWAEIADAEELVRGAIALCRSVGSEHHLRVEVAPGLPVFYADRDKLEGVLINLIENAVKYSPEGGEVAVRVSADDKEVLFEVQDQGVGIREEDLPRLFRSFERLHDSTWGQVSGTGVGLYICKHIMEAHGGDISVESTWGEGSTFRLHLPLYSTPPAVGEPCSEEQP